MNRVCVLTTPRSGSQLCENLIRDHIHAISLGEYFESWNQYKYTVVDGKLTPLDNTAVNAVFGINDNYLERLGILEQADINQPMVLRLFLLEKYDKNVLSTIIHKLHELNFNFVCLKRKPIIDQLLSYLIALHYKMHLKMNVFAINSNINIPVSLDILFAKKILGMLYPSLVNFDKNVNSIMGDIPKHNIEYDSIYEDLGRLYNTEFHQSGTKSIQGNPLDLIINKNEVIDLLKEYNIQINGK